MPALKCLKNRAGERGGESTCPYIQRNWLSPIHPKLLRDGPYKALSSSGAFISLKTTALNLRLPHTGTRLGFFVGAKREDKMEALVCRKLGDPTTSAPTDENSPVVLSKRHPIPPLNSPTSVRIQIKATSLNYANYLQILGKYQEKPPLPFIPGSDYSGIVIAVGPKVSKFKLGDRVCSFAADGSFAQFIVAEESRLYVSFSPLASFSFVYHNSHEFALIFSV